MKMPPKANRNRERQREGDRETERVGDETASKLVEEMFNICSQDVDSGVAQVLSKRDQKAADADPQNAISMQLQISWATRLGPVRGTGFVKPPFFYGSIIF